MMSGKVEGDRSVFAKAAAVLFLWALFAASDLLAAAPQKAASPKGSPPSLAEILRKAVAYCALFEKASLNYVCVEDVRTTTYWPLRVESGPPPIGLAGDKRDHVIYDYQLIRKGGKTEERRKLLENNGIRGGGKSEALSPGQFVYHNIILGPIILSKDWQLYHTYKIVGREKVGGEPCACIEAVPMPNAPPGNLYGKVWASERDGRIVKIQWFQESIQNYKQLVANGAALAGGEKLAAKPDVRLTMEYLLVKNGMGFPTRCRLVEAYITDTGLRCVHLDMTVTFRDYKFFTVETEVRTGE